MPPTSTPIIEDNECQLYFTDGWNPRTGFTTLLCGSGRFCVSGRERTEERPKSHGSLGKYIWVAEPREEGQVQTQDKNTTPWMVVFTSGESGDR